jgi:hypothetical protein
MMMDYRHLPQTLIIILFPTKNRCEIETDGICVPAFYLFRSASSLSSASTSIHAVTQILTTSHRDCYFGIIFLKNFDCARVDFLPHGKSLKVLR